MRLAVDIFIASSLLRLCPSAANEYRCVSHTCPENSRCIFAGTAESNASNVNTTGAVGADVLGEELPARADEWIQDEQSYLVFRSEDWHWPGWLPQLQLEVDAISHDSLSICASAATVRGESEAWCCASGDPSPGWPRQIEQLCEL